MSQTPYAPPAARVGDAPEPEYPKPAWIGRAVACLWACVVLVLVVAAFELFGVTPSANFLESMVTALVSAALLALIAAKSAAGRGWPRWLFLVLYVIGTLTFGASVLLAPEALQALGAVERISALAQFALQTAALVFLFTPASGQWFRSMGRSR